MIPLYRNSPYTPPPKLVGSRIKKGEKDGQIIVEPGYLLGPYGDEIVIDREVTVDLCHEGLDGNAVGPCVEPLDPWCSDVAVDRPTGWLYIAVRYAECQARPVRLFTSGCGCKENECEYSRTRDSYAIKVLTKLPSTYSDPMPSPGFDSVIRCSSSADQCGRPCQPCLEEPWVILADVMLSKDCKVAAIDCFRHRRYVISFAEYYLLCQSQPNPAGSSGQVLAEINKNLLGILALADMQAGLVKHPPPATVTVRSASGAWLALPAYFTVKPGETFASFLGREGERPFYDPSNDQTYSLREIYALADVDQGTTIQELADALAPLEGLRLQVADLRVVRAGLETLLEARGVEQLDRDHLGAPTAAHRLPATMLKRSRPEAALTEALASMTIADVASMTREAFAARMLEHAPESEQGDLERQAHELWSRARRVVTISDAWHSQG
jgi:hypothetical protein